jgi:hypothetical protein
MDVFDQVAAQPTAPPPPPPPGGGDVFDQVSSSPAPSAPAPATFAQTANGLADNLAAPEVDTMKGFLKGGMHTVAGLLNILGRGRQAAMDAQQQNNVSQGLETPQQAAVQPKDAIAGHVKDAADWINAHAQDHGIWQHVGDFGESALELMSPEGLAGLAGDTVKAGEVAGKGAEVSAKAAQLGDASKVAKLLDQYPRIKALLMIGAKAAQAGGEVGAQTYAKTGGDTQAAGEAALTGAAFGAGAGALDAGVTAARTAENTRQVTAAAHEAAPAVLAERTAAEGAARQAAAQQGVKDVAARATNDAFQRFNTGMAAVPGFTEAVAPVAPKTFAEGSEALKQVVRPLYQKADAAAGYDGELQNLMAQHKEAVANLDYKAANKAEDSIDALLENRPASVTPAEQAAMKMGWRDAKVLDKVHAATEGAFNGISEDMAAEPGTSARKLKGGSKESGSLQTNMGRVLDTPAKAKEAYRVLGRDGVANLYRASYLVSTPEMAKATAALAEQVAAEFPAAEEGTLHKVVGGALGAAAGGALGHAAAGGTGAEVGALLGGAGGKMLSDGARDVMRKMAMSPRIGQLMDFAVRNNVSPKIAAAAVAAEMRREQGEHP